MAVGVERFALTQAYREASGSAYIAELNAARESLAQSSRLSRGLHLLRTGGTRIDYDYDKDRRRRDSGMRNLDRLMCEQGGQYPRGPITYLIDGDYKKQAFDYTVIFPGERIGEEDQVELNPKKLGYNYTPNPLWLRRGAEAIVDITENGAHVLHLPEGEGIVWRPQIDRSVHWAYFGDWINLATWYPDLTDSPKPFSHPEGGRFVWNTNSQR